MSRLPIDRQRESQGGKNDWFDNRTWSPLKYMEPNSSHLFCSKTARILLHNIYCNTKHFNLNTGLANRKRRANFKKQMALTKLSRYYYKRCNVK